jgi:hypothetical protein
VEVFRSDTKKYSPISRYSPLEDLAVPADPALLGEFNETLTLLRAAFQVLQEEKTVGGYKWTLSYLGIRCNARLFFGVEGPYTIGNELMETEDGVFLVIKLSVSLTIATDGLESITHLCKRIAEIASPYGSGGCWSLCTNSLEVHAGGAWWAPGAFGTSNSPRVPLSLTHQPFLLKAELSDTDARLERVISSFKQILASIASESNQGRIRVAMTSAA